MNEWIVFCFVVGLIGLAIELLGVCVVFIVKEIRRRLNDRSQVDP